MFVSQSAKPGTTPSPPLHLHLSIYYHSSGRLCRVGFAPPLQPSLSIVVNTHTWSFRGFDNWHTNWEKMRFLKWDYDPLYELYIYTLYVCIYVWIFIYMTLLVEVMLWSKYHDERHMPVFLWVILLEVDLVHVFFMDLQHSCHHCQWFLYIAFIHIFFFYWKSCIAPLASPFYAWETAYSILFVMHCHSYIALLEWQFSKHIVSVLSKSLECQSV